MSWTRGHYRLFRIILGLYLLCHFWQLMPYLAELFSSQGMIPDAGVSPLSHCFPNLLTFFDPPWVVHCLGGAALVASLLLLFGIWDGIAGLVIWYVLACFVGRNPLIANPSLPFVGWLLIAHFLVRLSLRKGELQWRMPTGIYLAAWVVMAIGYSYSGIAKLASPSWVDGTALIEILNGPLARPGALRALIPALPLPLLKLLTWSVLGLEIGFVPLVLLRRVRPWAWASMLVMHCMLIGVIRFADLSLGMVMVHLFTCDPGWIRGRRDRGAEWVFYDGSCGLCHGFVRLLLSEEPRPQRFKFAPLQGRRFHELAQGRQFPDSLVVLTERGTFLVEAVAVGYLLRRMAGVHCVCGWLLCLIPCSLANGAYRLVARFRQRFVKAPDGPCPVLPPPLRVRFDLDPAMLEPMDTACR